MIENANIYHKYTDYETSNIVVFQYHYKVVIIRQYLK